jgi:uncharacterized damage-inducible protein DinB
LDVVDGLLEMFRYKTWATLRLIEYCQGLGDEDLDATIPGTYGTIRETLRHLVYAEEGYLSILTRKRFATKAEGEAYEKSVVASRKPATSVAEFADRVMAMGPRWEALAQDPGLPGREVTTTDGWRLPATVILAQTIQHAADHRTHVMSILGARGLELPVPNDLDAWGYAEAMEMAQELPAT